MSVEKTEEEIKEILNSAVDLAKAAGQVMKQAFYREKLVDTKNSYADLVTETDAAIERMVIGIIKEKYPSHRFIGEETTTPGKPCVFTDEPTWICDPIDGTTNFVHGIPEVSFSLGVTVNKKPVVGVIYLPIMDEMYTAREGHGAFCNGRKISVNKVEELSQAVVLSEGGNERDPKWIQYTADNIKQILTNTRGHRATGSTAVDFCRLASGKGEAYFQYDIHCWDMAAGIVIAREAGAVVMDPTGDDVDLMSRRVLAASSKKLAQELSSVISHFSIGRD